MKKRNLLILSLISLFALGACAKGSGKNPDNNGNTPEVPDNPGGGGGGGGGDDPEPPIPDHTDAEVKEYMDGLKKTSVENHLYIHYHRWNNTVTDYDKWDVWAWPLYLCGDGSSGGGRRYTYKMTAAEGYAFRGGFCRISL